MAKTTTLKELISAEFTDETLKTINYEQGVTLLEELVKSVESGSLSLDQSVLSYERGVLLMQHLRSLLAGAEEKIKLLS